MHALPSKRKGEEEYLKGEKNERILVSLTRMGFALLY
jgi:hypothetical protein